MSDRPTDQPDHGEEPGAAFPVVLGGRAGSGDVLGDRALRARWIADAFAQRFPATLPPPGADGGPSPGRHVRCTAETPGQLYVGGQVFARDARARITARAAGMPSGWSVRLTIVDVHFVRLAPGTPPSRAHPDVLRAQRQIANPAAGAALAAPLRQHFPGRPVHGDVHSLFVPTGMTFLREASVSIPLPERAADDLELLERLCSAALTAVPSPADAPTPRPAPAPEPGLRRGHLRIVQ